MMGCGARRTELFDLCQSFPFFGLNMGLTENTPQGSDWDFRFSWNDGGVDSLL
jgi:hypothetical protein